MKINPRAPAKINSHERPGNFCHESSLDFTLAVSRSLIFIFPLVIEYLSNSRDCNLAGEKIVLFFSAHAVRCVDDV